ncbi:MAG TPA: outer membrane lipoprotein carrier protein LolA [Myxococcota bacterium]|nr:outer membrane lipoprotein carrier protein LolA [Myxococcota bacterium]
MHRAVARALHAFGALACFASVAAAEPAAVPPDLQSLARRFAEMPGLSARFEEEKHLSLLRAPLKSEGTLYYARPDLIARKTERPAASSWVLQGETLAIRGPDGERSLDLASAPGLQPFIEALRALLRGDLSALERGFEIAFDSPDAASGRWRIRLTPREAPLRDAVAAIEVEGAGEILSTFRVREVGGDETVDRFTQVDPLRSFSEAERTRIFDVATP